MLTIEKLPRQSKYNSKIQHFVVKFDGAEVGVIEKIPNQPFVGRLISSVKEVGSYQTKEEAAKAVYKAHMSSLVCMHTRAPRLYS